MSVAGSIAGSVGGRSRGPAYRTVGRTADVDESLFGAANKTAPRPHMSPGNEKEITIIGKDGEGPKEDPSSRRGACWWPRAGSGDRRV